jgi:hypothetical protein
MNRIEKKRCANSVHYKPESKNKTLERVLGTLDHRSWHKKIIFKKESLYLVRFTLRAEFHF